MPGEIDSGYFFSVVNKVGVIFFAVAAGVVPLSACEKELPVSRPSVAYLEHPDNLEFTITLPPDVASTGVEFANVTYGIENAEQCVPVDPTLALGGLRPMFTEKRDVPLRLEQTSVYAGVVAATLFKPEDYYGKGKCRWSMQTIAVHLKMYPRSIQTQTDPNGVWINGMRIWVHRDDLMRGSSRDLSCVKTALDPFALCRFLDQESPKSVIFNLTLATKE